MKEDSDYQTLAESFWCLFHRKTKNLVDGLSWRQLRSIIATIDATSIADWMVWREGEVEWTPLVKRLESLISEPVSQYLIPPVAPLLKDTPTQTKSLTKTRPALSATATGLTKTEILPEIDRRMTKRFNKTVEIQIEAKGHKLRTRTKNISVLGIKLENDLPFPIEGSFKLTLMCKPHPIELVCQMIKGEKGYMLSQLKILPNPNMEKLSDFLLNP